MMGEEHTPMWQLTIDAGAVLTTGVAAVDLMIVAAVDGIAIADPRTPAHAVTERTACNTAAFQRNYELYMYM